MERRSAIKNLLLISGGFVLLPSCVQTPKKQGPADFSKLNISTDQIKLVAEIAETIIPATNTPGAKALNIHLFVLKMLNDCYEQKDREAFLKGLEMVNSVAGQQFGSPFINCTKAQKEGVLNIIEVDKKQFGSFYSMMKQRTIQGYLNSKYVMTNLLVYKLIPSKYNGYFPVKTTQQHG
jgi:hypothetical protein